MLSFSLMFEFFDFLGNEPPEPPKLINNDDFVTIKSSDNFNTVTSKLPPLKSFDDPVQAHKYIKYHYNELDHDELHPLAKKNMETYLDHQKGTLGIGDYYRHGWKQYAVPTALAHGALALGGAYAGKKILDKKK